MAYLGRGLDKISNIEVLDNITFDGSSSYSITKGSVAFTPNSAQSLLISIDGVVQATNFYSFKFYQILTLALLYQAQVFVISFYIMEQEL